MTLAAKKEPLVFKVGEDTFGKMPCNVDSFFKAVDVVLGQNPPPNATLWYRGTE